eukprot:jgi/Chlat1/8616/Chrsp86S08006
MSSAMLPSTLRTKFPNLRGGWAPPCGWPDRILEEGEDDVVAALHDAEYQDASTEAEDDNDEKTMDGQDNDGDDSDSSAHNHNHNNYSDHDALPQPPGAMYVNRSETVQYLLERHLKLLEKWHLPGDGTHEHHSNTDTPSSPSTPTTTNTTTTTSTALPSHNKRKTACSPEQTTPSRTRQRVRAQQPKTAQQQQHTLSTPNTSPSTQERPYTPLTHLRVDVPNSHNSNIQKNHSNDSNNDATLLTPALPKVKRRGACIRVTTPSAAADRRRRDRMNERFERLRMMVPGNQGLSSTQISKAGVLDAAIEYVKKLQALSEASSSDDIVNVRDGREDGVMIARIRYASRKPLLHDILRAIAELKLQVLDGRYAVEGDKLKGDFLVKKTAVSVSVDSAKLKDTLKEVINKTTSPNNIHTHNDIKHEPSSSKKHCMYRDSVSISASKYTSVLSDNFLSMPPCA